MTDETTTLEPEAADPEPPAAVEAAVPAEPVSFWHRPNVERYVLPLVIPIVVVLGVVIYVLNISRVFLSGTSNIAVVVCSVILLTILVGATILSNSKRLRSSSIVLITVTYVLVVVASGWLVLGQSQLKEDEGGSLPAAGPFIGEIDMVASPTGGLTFAPSSVSAKTGIYKITLKNGAAAQHTLDFDDAATLFPGLIVNDKGETLSARIFFGSEGAYTFFCAVTGHRAGGMEGVVNVTGPPMTLEEAEAAAAKAGGGEAPAAES